MKPLNFFITLGTAVIAASMLANAFADKTLKNTILPEKLCELKVSAQSLEKIQKSIGPIMEQVQNFQGIHPEAVRPMCQHIKNMGELKNTALTMEQLNELSMAKSIIGLSLSYQLSQTSHISLLKGRDIAKSLGNETSTKRWTQADVLVNLREEAKRFAQENAALADVSVDKLNYEIRGNDVSKSSDFTSYIEQNFQP